MVRLMTKVGPFGDIGDHSAKPLLGEPTMGHKAL